MWYNFHRQIGWTTEHKLCEQASDAMLAWVSNYFDHFVRPLESLIAADFRDNLAARADGLDWLASKVPTDHCNLLRHWWSMAAIIVGITSGRHPDTDDAEPTVLINFGCKVLFEVDGSVVCLHPGDVLLFQSKLWHKAIRIKHTASTELAKRFAVSLSMRTHIKQRAEGEKMDMNIEDTMDPPVNEGRRRLRNRRVHVP